MFEAATGSEESARRFAALGVAFQNQDGTLRATDAVLLDLAERFEAMPDGAQKSALAVELFGKSGAELIPFLNQGREGIAALTSEMEALGVQIGGETAAQAEAFNDALAKVKLATTSIANRVIEAFLVAEAIGPSASTWPQSDGGRPLSPRERAGRLAARDAVRGRLRGGA